MSVNQSNLSNSINFEIRRASGPHAKIAMRLNDSTFQRVKDYINRKEEPSKEYVLARATLIRDSIILCEYDFVLRRLLNRTQAKSKAVYFETLEKIRQIRQNQIDFCP